MKASEIGVKGIRSKRELASRNVNGRDERKKPTTRPNDEGGFRFEDEGGKVRSRGV